MDELSTIERAILAALVASGDRGMNLSAIGYALLEAGVVTSQRPHINPQGAALMAAPHMAELRDRDLLQRRFRGVGYEITRAGCVAHQKSQESPTADESVLATNHLTAKQSQT
ncbi:hypothetical protein LN565_00565 [Xanthomonas euvesicatoria pv. euvesicatoria]|uniref:Uncharacterized protein n=3 Tax=Xanthomonas TaxID=338 RepID=A0A6V7FJ60_9XANT|nr:MULTISPECIES: hypothetical protein [Xanthomonas]KGE50352.1 hypothetical protein GW15_0221555 [Xanthomonas axonopodis pv. vasculorum]KLA50950.1 hypothetical protein XEUV683_18110 [Xanthomonas euvesicatoria]KLA58918.1 hypothetical protein XEUV684_12210 [Xanthomonas euvesicatoria]KLA60040.1 hypothetical protein XEUV685_01990 [Xanthomonas euvesicatoria]KLA63315.1 hypothetical protein XEUV689_20655 [Xanthomonas euvesicatoria]